MLTKIQTADTSHHHEHERYKWDRPTLRRNLRLTLIFDLIVLLLIAGFIAFYRTNDISLHFVDESTHVRVTQEMMKSGDLWHPKVFGRDYFNKPPFKMWLSILPVSIFGHTNFAYRFLDGLCGVLSVLSVYLFGRVVFRSRIVGLIAALTLITSKAYVFHHGLRTATQDSMVNFLNLISAFIGWKILSLLRRESSNSKAGRKKLLGYAVAGGLVVGIAALTKNVAGYIPLFILAVFSVLSGDIKVILSRGKLPIAIVIGLGVLLPALYLVPHCLVSRAMCQVMFGDEVYERATVGYHNQTRPLFYLKRLLYRAGPPPELLILGMILGLGYWLFRKERRYLFVLIWAFAPLVVFSLVPSRLTWYMVPAFPGCVLLCGVAFEVIFKQTVRNSSLWWHGNNKRLFATILFGSYLAFCVFGLGKHAYAVVNYLVNRQYRIDIDLVSEEIFRNPVLAKTRFLTYSDPGLARNERIYRDRIPITEEVTSFDVLKQKINDPTTGFVLTDLKEFPKVAALRSFVGYRLLPPENFRFPWGIILSYVPDVLSLEKVKQPVDFGEKDAEALLYGWGVPKSFSGVMVRRIAASEAAFLFPADETHEVLPGIFRINAKISDTKKVSSVDVEVSVNEKSIGSFKLGGEKLRTYELPFPAGVFHSPRSVITIKLSGVEISTEYLSGPVMVNWASVEVLSGPGIEAKSLEKPNEAAPPSEEEMKEGG